MSILFKLDAYANIRIMMSDVTRERTKRVESENAVQDKLKRKGNGTFPDYPCKGRGSRTFNTAARNHHDAFTQDRTIGKLEDGGSLTSVTQKFGTYKSVVS